MIPAQKLSGEELKTLNSFSVADAIRYFSGVQIKDYGGIGGLKLSMCEAWDKPCRSFLRWHSIGQRAKWTNRLREIFT